MAKLTDEKLIGKLMNEYGWSREATINGYDIFEIDGALEVCRIDALYWCEEFDYGINTDQDACMQAEMDGVKFINDMDGLEKHRYVDTPENREFCERFIAIIGRFGMSYWGNQFMPTVDSLALPLIREMATFSVYTEQALLDAWYGRYVEFAYEEAEGDIYKHFDATIDNLKDFFNSVLERDL